jgi:hypothetical protein
MPLQRLLQLRIRYQHSTARDVGEAVCIASGVILGLSLDHCRRDRALLQAGSAKSMGCAHAGVLSGMEERI